METSKDIIRNILSTYRKIEIEMWENQVEMSDFTFEDIVDMIYEYME